MKEEVHYEYRWEDRSVLLRWLQPGLFEPLVRVLPRALTPNQITVAGQLAAGGGLALALFGRPAGPGTLVLLSAALLFYALADCVDGLFARHTRQTSRLGEFLDHWLDALSVPAVVLCYGLVLPADPRLVFTATLASAFLHFATFLHGYRRGFVHLGEIGIIEATFIGAVICLVSAVIGTGWLAAPLLGGLSAASLLVLATLAGAFAALWSMRGLMHHLRDFTAVASLLAVVGLWYGLGRLSPALAAGLAIAVTARFEGLVIRARLVRQPLVLRDPGLAVLLAGGCAAALALDLPARGQTALAGLALAYAAVRSGRAFSRTVAELSGQPKVATPAGPAHKS